MFVLWGMLADTRHRCSTRALRPPNKVKQKPNDGTTPSLARKRFDSDANSKKGRRRRGVRNTSCTIVSCTKHATMALSGPFVRARLVYSNGAHVPTTQAAVLPAVRGSH